MGNGRLMFAFMTSWQRGALSLQENKKMKTRFQQEKDDTKGEDNKRCRRVILKPDR
jgi:urease alpha subunit